ncbi:transposase [Hymenobacter cavernae]|uniref:Transposase IS200-like domain-containing protein n=1 Tax=Hymenobacter cavernae TaxID=2044852 RepID=A0ABQ1U0N8_9BACT|nr:transposase [Hymenobacter cavernae]GGF08439.1 hypothetical protein GCM10011383_19500 [Hymenobacter cavernae]
MINSSFSTILPPGETLFVTFRLAGSVPVGLARQLHQQRQAAQEIARALATDAERLAAHHRAEKAFFAAFDALLDAATVGPFFLEKEKIAELIAGELMLLEELGFRVLAFALLPNHVHTILHLPTGADVSFYKALQLLHQRTAAQCRRVLRATLPPEADFWQTGSYDYVVQDATELGRIARYVLHHAQPLRLPARWQTWPYVYAAPEWETV